jgi:hypothetical protein
MVPFRRDHDADSPASYHTKSNSPWEGIKFYLAISSTASFQSHFQAVSFAPFNSCHAELLHDDTQKVTKENRIILLDCRAKQKPTQKSRFHYWLPVTQVTIVRVVVQRLLSALAEND